MNEVYYLKEDGLFTEVLTIEKLKNCKNKNVIFMDNHGNAFDRQEMIDRLVNSIKQEGEACRKMLQEEGLSGRSEKGRFGRANINAKKIIAEVEDIYLLYLLCGTMEKAADKLGVSRQTFSKLIRQYTESI